MFYIHESQVYYNSFLIVAGIGNINPLMQFFYSINIIIIISLLEESTKLTIILILQSFLCENA